MFRFWALGSGLHPLFDARNSRLKEKFDCFPAFQLQESTSPKASDFTRNLRRPCFLGIPEQILKTEYQYPLLPRYARRCRMRVAPLLAIWPLMIESDC